MILRLFTALFFLLSTPAMAKSGVVRAQDVTVKEILSGEIFSAENGATIHLSGIYVPPELTLEAEQWLKENVLGKSLSLWHDASHKNPPLNRYGRIYAYAQMPDGIYLESLMIEKGLAFALTQEGSKNIAPALLAAEEKARREKNGLWANSHFKILQADDPTSLPKGQFSIVEGIIHQATLKKNRLYLNFGTDWKTDFTLSLTPSAVRSSGKSVDDWRSLHVRARGWIENINGPLITVTHLEQIEILSNPR